MPDTQDYVLQLLTIDFSAVILIVTLIGLRQSNYAFNPHWAWAMTHG